MFQHQGIWLPDGEKHFPQWMTDNGEIVDGRGTYQIKKFREAMKWCRKFETALDVGGHVGLWSMQMSKLFGQVHAFEPVSQFRSCFRENVLASNVVLHECALGSYPGHVTMKIPELDGGLDTGGTHVNLTSNNYSPTAPGSVELKMLDEFQFRQVDFIKIDCEGYELEVLKGGLNTLESKPCIIVEQKPHKLMANYGTKGAPAVDYLLGLGAKLRTELSGDFILSWD